MTEEIQQESVGYRLRQAREQRELTHKSVANQLNLGVQTVVALEESDVDKLPPPSFIRGYLRAYARLLGLDADNLVSHYNELAPDDPRLASVKMIKEAGRKTSLVYWMTPVIAITICILLGSWWYGFYYTQGGVGFDPLSESIQSEVPLRENEVPLVSTVEADMAEAELWGSDSAALVEKTDSEPTGTTANINLVDSTESVTEEEVAAALVDVSAAISQEPIAEVPDAGSAPNDSDTLAEVPPPTGDERETGQAQAENSDILEIVTDSDSWVEIVDANGARLMYNMLKPEQSRKLRGTAPFLVFLGNTPGVLMTMNGTVVQDPEYHHGSNTSRFIIYADGSLHH